MSRPVEYVYKLHPWRKPKKETETGYLFSQLIDEFYSRSFIRVMHAHCALMGRIPPNDKAITAKIVYHFQNGYLIRRGVWSNEWKEWNLRLKRETAVLPCPSEFPSESPVAVLEDDEIKKILDKLPDLDKRDEPAPEPYADPTEDVLKKLGYLQ